MICAQGRTNSPSSAPCLAGSVLLCSRARRRLGTGTRLKPVASVCRQPPRSRPLRMRTLSGVPGEGLAPELPLPAAAFRLRRGWKQKPLSAVFCVQGVSVRCAKHRNTSSRYCRAAAPCLTGRGLSKS